MAQGRVSATLKADEIKALVNAVAQSEFLHSFYGVFHDLTGLLLDFRDPTGAYCAPMHSGGDIVSFCRSMCSNPRTYRWCQECSLAKIRQIVREQRPTIFPCHAGLYGMVVPIIARGVTVGVITAGVMLLSPPTVQEFNQKLRPRLRRIGAQPDKLQEQWLALPVGEERMLQAACDMLRLVAEYVAEKEHEFRQMQKRIEHPAVVEAKEYIRLHLEDRLQLKHIARGASVSPNYLCWLFRKGTGVSIYNYIWQQRISLAKELLSSSDVKITQIGLQVGFQSPNHFFRVFRRVVGVTPLSFRRRSASRNLQR